MTIDPRLLERRKAVAEDQAKRNVGRLLRFLAFVVVIGSLVWIALSPWMSVDQVRTVGVVSSDTHSILAAHNVVAGTPMVFLRPGQVEAGLEQDPWVRDARVHLDWPNEVIVWVDERVPVAWVQTTGGWARRAGDGHSVTGPDVPDDTMPKILLPVVEDRLATESSLLLGAVRFAAALPAETGSVTTVSTEDGELWADVDDLRVHLGRPVDMEAKALSLIAMLREPIEEGSVLVLVAPTHPAVQPPPGDPSGDGEQP